MKSDFISLLARVLVKGVIMVLPAVVVMIGGLNQTLASEQIPEESQAAPHAPSVDRPRVLIYAYPFDYSFRYDKNEEQDYRRFDLRVLAVGLAFNRYDITFEVSHFDWSSQVGSLGVAREQQEYHFWGRASLWSWKYLDIYGGLAVGSYDETIKTTLGASSVKSTSQWNWSTGAAAGVNFHIFKYLLSAIELRTMFGKDFDPQPQLGGLLRLGVRF